MLLFRNYYSSICVTLAVFLQAVVQEVDSKPPHVLFIVADDFGWNDVGYHGSEIHTPILDRLAADGVKLDSYYVQPICTPTRSQLLTGRYQIHLGLQHSVIRPPQPNGVPLGVPTIADKLREVGYATHMVGKWHIGFYKKEYTPTYRGFDSFYGYLIGAEDYFTHKRCFNIREPSKKMRLCGLDLHDNEKAVRNESDVYSTRLFTSRAERIVEEHAKSGTDKPLFLYLPLQAVHSPLEAPAEYTRPYEFIKDKARRKYAGMVSCMDEAVANITRAFKKNGLWENTVLIFSTDNGGQVAEGGNNWPLRGWKGSLWEGGIRGVGFVNSPLLEKNGTTTKELMHVSDWFPTLMHLAGADTTGLNLDGFNLWPTISKGAPSQRKELLHNIDPLEYPHGKALDGSGFDTRVRAAVRVGRWKLITGNPGPGSWVPPPHKADTTLYYRQHDHVHNANDKTLRFIPRHNQKRTDKQNLWLFDIMEDPLEMNEVSQEHPSVVLRLLQRLQFYNSTAVPVRFPSEDPNADPAKHGGVWGPWQD